MNSKGSPEHLPGLIHYLLALVLKLLLMTEKKQCQPSWDIPTLLFIQSVPCPHLNPGTSY